MLKRIIKAVTVAVTIVCLVVCFIPVQAFADPVSATIIANAFAQAIAAYGASNGVAMTFDVSSSDGIGENVHELWKSFREGTQGVDDYATLASAMFPELYYKASAVVGGVSDAYAVGVHVSDSFAEEFDNFYNWLLSGPAEMVQVDNQYYEFSQNQVGANSTPINVFIGSSSLGPYPFLPHNQPGTAYYNNGLYIYTGTTGNVYHACGVEGPVYLFKYIFSSRTYLAVVSSSTHNALGQPIFVDYRYTPANSDTVFAGDTSYPNILDSTTSLYYNYLDWTSEANYDLLVVPGYSSISDGLSAVASQISDPSLNADTIGVKAYDSSGIADIPDTADPNYDALNRARDIPLNIPWDDAIYGDGTGILTDAQTQAIANDVDLTLVQDGVIELVDESNPPAPDPGEVYVPFLPVTLPNFNFNLSGIWHYVREWVTSLGSWFSVLFTIWNTLPYAMIVPVYATAVVVIVLGVYKRFFM